MGRRESRDAAVKIVFQQGFHSNEEIITESMISTFIDNAQFFDDDDIEKKNDLNYTQELDMPYLKNVLDGVFENLETLDGMINRHAKGWTVSRMARMDVAILRVAVYEILYRDDIPYSVSVNEAVELAKKYSHDDAGSFINGILASIINEIEGANG